MRFPRLLPKSREASLGTPLGAPLRRDWRNAFRPRPEALETRCLLSAGDLDPSFGTGGLVTTDIPGPTAETAYGVTVVQPDGKIVVAGTAVGGTGPIGFALARYNADGTLDGTFGSGGRVVPDPVTMPGRATALAVQPDGKIVVAGTAGGFAVLRFNSDGSLDTGFGSGGEVVTNDGQLGFARSVAVQADGKIVVAGNSYYHDGTSFDFALARYNADGTLDPSFGTGGEVLTDFGGYFDAAYGVAIQPDGKIVAAGEGAEAGGSNYTDFAVARYNPDGSLDPSFGSGGTVTADLGSSSDVIQGLALQADGKVVTAGFTYQAGYESALTRFNADGTLDLGFGTGGTVLTRVGGNYSRADSVVIQGDGKILTAGGSGIVNSATGVDFALARYNTDGTLDSSFGSGGQVVTDFAGLYDEAFALALQADGKAVAAGVSVQLVTGADFALARYNADGTLDSGFGSGGTVTTNMSQGPTQDYARAGVALQADGKLVVAGAAYGPLGPNFAVARYNADGTLDSGFGSGGTVTTNFGANSFAYGTAIQADGKIVVVGQIFESDGPSFALARYNTDGTLDSSFGSGGEVTSTFGSGSVRLADQAWSVALQADGKIVVAGDSGSDFAVARYNTDGTLDSGFGDGGEATADFNGNASAALSVAVQPDGKIVLAGGAFTQLALARFNSDGSLDPNFGSGGEVLASLSGSANTAYGVAVQPDGKIVTAGVSLQNQTGRDFLVARFDADGNLDKKFGSQGEVVTDFGSSDDEAFALALQGDGKIVLAGETLGAGTAYDFALARYNSDGSLDAKFGNGGLVTTDFSGFPEQALGVAIQPDGKIVVAGTSYQPGTGFDLALARYIGVSPSGPIDTMIAQVEGLVADGTLNNGQANSLLVKLEHALQHLDSGQNATAANDLQAFINEVNDYLAEGIFTAPVAQPLIDEAGAVIVQIGGKKNAS